MAKKLSIFIEDTNLRVLLCDNEKIVKWASLPFDAGLVANGVVTDEEKLAMLIKQQFNFLQFGQNWDIIGLTGLNSLYRIINLPQMADRLLAEAIRHEAERVMPIAINDVYLSYQVIPGGNPGEKRIFLAAFPKAGADSIIRTIRRAGLEPYMLDIAPLALARTISESRAVAVNSRGSNLDIVVVSDKIPQLLRSLPLPSEAASMTEKLAAIAEEVERTIAFYNQSQPEHPLDEKVPVLVTGDLAQMKEGWEILATRLGHPVNPIPSPMQEPAGFDAAQYMVNIGLVLKESPREKGVDANLIINFNALPAAYYHRQISPLNIIVPVIAMVVLAADIAMGYMTMGISSHVATLEAEAASLQKQIMTQQSDLTSLKSKITQLQPQMPPLQVKTAALAGKVAALTASRVNSDAQISQIVGLLPATSDLTGLNYATGTNVITITGSSGNIGDIYSYARALRGSNFSVNITSIQFQTTTTATLTTTGYTYNLVLKIN